MTERERTPYGVERTVLRDPRLGVLRYNPHLRWWEGDLADDAALYVDGPEDPEPGFLATTRERAIEVQARVRAAIAFAEARLAPKTTTPWPSPEHFADAVSLSSITLKADGTAEIYLDDGDLFLGQGIVVTLARDGALLDATLTTPD